MTDTLSLEELITCMDKGETFAIGFRTCDRRQNTGGEYIEFSAAVKHNHATKEERKTAGALPKQRVLKDPQHYPNSTRNIKVLATGKLVKVHLRLITMFNHKAIL